MTVNKTDSINLKEQEEDTCISMMMEIIEELDAFHIIKGSKVVWYDKDSSPRWTELSPTEFVAYIQSKLNYNLEPYITRRNVLRLFQDLERVFIDFGIGKEKLCKETIEGLGSHYEVTKAALEELVKHTRNPKWSNLIRLTDKLYPELGLRSLSPRERNKMLVRAGVALDYKVYHQSVHKTLPQYGTSYECMITSEASNAVVLNIVDSTLNQVVRDVTTSINN